MQIVSRNDSFHKIEIFLKLRSYIPLLRKLGNVLGVLNCIYQNNSKQYVSLKCLQSLVWYTIYAKKDTFS